MTTIHYQLTRREALHSLVRRRMFRPLSLWVKGILLAGALASLTLPRPAPDVGVFILVLLAALTILGYLLLARLVDKAPWLTAPTVFTFGDTGVVLEAGDIRNDLKWSAFGRWRRTAEHFLLYLGRTDAALHVPLRAFSAEQLAEFTRYLPRIGPS